MAGGSEKASVDKQIKPYKAENEAEQVLLDTVDRAFADMLESMHKSLVAAIKEGIDE